jgi:hypothetical protein
MPSALKYNGEPMIRRLLCLSLSVALAVGIVSPLAVKADTKLDEIEEYKITVDMESDGSMDLTYHIDWKVLDSISEGPLTWVKIGIPNQYADNIKALSSNISDIYYYTEDGDYVRIDLDRSYGAGEIVTMDFSVHQSNMYTLDYDNNQCRYEFTPGWFDNIDVKSIMILWNDENVVNSDAHGTEENYLVWKASLAAGEKYSVTVNYSADAFDTTGYNGSVSSDSPTYDPAGGETGEDIGYTYDDYSYSGDSGPGIIIIVPIIFVVIIIIVAGIIKGGGGGGYDGGFGTRTGYHGGIIGGGHCACACAGCACACACAGGGRAGCSAKNLYGSAAQTDKLKHVLLKVQK